MIEFIWEVVFSKNISVVDVECINNKWEDVCDIGVFQKEVDVIEDVGDILCLLKVLDIYSNKKLVEIWIFEQIYLVIGFLFSVVGCDGKVNFLYVIGGVEGIVFGGE